jgi:hypothetical protein
MRQLTLLLFVFHLGCDFGVVAVDPPVEYETGQGLIEGDPGVVLGVFSEQLYEPLEAGDAAPITRASQGGTWTHPALRTTGIGPKALVDCTVTADDGERVGNSSSVEFFTYTGEGYLEIQAYPVRIAHTGTGKGPEIDDLFGAMATLHCRVVDDEDKSRAAEASVEVELTDG